MVEITWLVLVYRISWCVDDGPVKEINFISNIHNTLYMYNVYIKYDI